MRRRAALFLLALAPVAAAAACKGSADQGTIQVLVVDDPFTGPPAATTLEVAGIGLDGGITPLAAPQPIGQATIDLGTRDETEVDAVQVTAKDGAGNWVAWGASLPVELGALANATLDVFVQRTGTLSRMPGPLADGRNAPLVGALGDRYVFVAGGSDSAFQTQTELYDLLSWAPLPSPPTLSTAPQSMALLQLEALTIDASGGTWFDFTTSSSAAATGPTGSGAWSDVAGGATVAGPDGSSYIIGGTRLTGAPSAAVLVVNASGTLAFAQLKTARLGAAAGWVGGVGLVVAGGSGAAGAAGVEVIGGPSVTTSTVIPFPPDPTTGAGLDALDATHMLLVGGTTARVLDLSCTSSCAAAPWTAPLPTPLALAQVFAIDGSSAFVVGEDAVGAMHAYRMSASLVQEVAFRVPRNHARALRLPTGAVAVVGGAPSMESFVP